MSDSKPYGSGGNCCRDADQRASQGRTQNAFGKCSGAGVPPGIGASRRCVFAGETPAHRGPEARATIFQARSPAASRSDEAMVAVGLSPRTADRQTLRRRAATRELSDMTMAFNSEKAVSHEKAQKAQNTPLTVPSETPSLVATEVTRLTFAVEDMGHPEPPYVGCYFFNGLLTPPRRGTKESFASAQTLTGSRATFSTPPFSFCAFCAFSWPSISYFTLNRGLKPTATFTASLREAGSKSQIANRKS